MVGAKALMKDNTSECRMGDSCFWKVVMLTDESWKANDKIFKSYFNHKQELKEALELSPDVALCNVAWPALLSMRITCNKGMHMTGKSSYKDIQNCNHSDMIGFQVTPVLVRRLLWKIICLFNYWNGSSGTGVRDFVVNFFVDVSCGRSDQISRRVNFLIIMWELGEGVNQRK